MQYLWNTEFEKMNLSCESPVYKNSKVTIILYALTVMLLECIQCVIVDSIKFHGL